MNSLTTVFVVGLMFLASWMIKSATKAVEQKDMVKAVREGGLFFLILTVMLMVLIVGVTYTP